VSVITGLRRCALVVCAVVRPVSEDRVCRAAVHRPDSRSGGSQGEREWNLGFGLTDQSRFDRYEALVEYEWAPVNRLGLEVEVPFTFFPAASNGPTPSNRIEGLKTAVQWSFLVSEEHQTSMALGYLNELVLPNLDRSASRS